MKYVLLMYSDESIGAQLTPEEMADLQPAWFALLKEMKTAGVLVENNGMMPVANATTVRVREGKTMITDGPFAETHEQLGGYFVLDCENLDEVIAWAAKIPTAKLGSIEIRPQWDAETT
jgi:hypothetical protein